MATYQLNQTLSDGTAQPVTFEIPNETGTYRLTFNTSDGKTFTGDVEVIGNETHISQEVSGTTGSKTISSPSGYMRYYAIITASVGIGTMSNLDVTLIDDIVSEYEISYIESTGYISVTLYSQERRAAVSALVTGTLTTPKEYKRYQIDVTLSNGQVLSSTIET